ncbi:J domain-containing protein [Methanolobus chelungpuianus]|uniref:J domain-containing protein n=1 Tax=Methanolobus chelungpuianus TaxID=502115 RepID=UPI0021152C0A|nr:DnaJ domain-containing protein [Methanolobus chelungpuianus]
MSVPDYYSVLGMSPGASQEELKKRYRALMTKYHPDLNHAPGAEERSKRINEAYGILSDPEKRARYDRSFHLHSPGFTAPWGSYGSAYGNPDEGNNYSNFRNHSYGNFTYRTYTYRRGPGSPKTAGSTGFHGMLLRSVLKVAALLAVLWLLVHFFVLFVFLAFMMMLIYLVCIVLGQLLAIFLGRR